MELRSYINKIIQKLKRDPGYMLDTAMDRRVLFQTLQYRGISLLYGLWHCLWLRKYHFPLFVGAYVRLRYPQLISVGRSVIIEDYVFIDALSHNGVQFGDNVTIAKFSTIQCTGVIRNVGVGITIGNDSAVGAYSFLGAQGGIRIGNNVIMGPRVNFHSENHNYQDVTVPIRLQGETRRGIIVDDNCWIGAGSIILDGVHIYSGCVVAAASVVTQDMPPNSVIAGIPARVIKQRGDTE